MSQSSSHDRRIQAHHKRLMHKRLKLRQSVLGWTSVLVALLLAFKNCDAQNTSSSTILAHPSMFGSPWTGIVTAAVLKTTANLCDDTLETTDENIFFQWSSNELNEQYEIAIFYDDPSAQEWRGSCDDSQMAQTAQRLYPSAKYLLISKDSLSAMKKTDDEPDTTLSLASIQLEDAEAINNLFQNETGAFVSTGVILLTIDAYSRAYFDTCNCSSDQDEVDRKRLWATTFRAGSCLSILGSTYVIISLIATRARRKKNMRLLFNRLLISICLFDIMSSIAFFMGQWMAPASPPGDFEKYYSQAQWDVDNPDAFGNTATCTVQGILVQLGVLGSSLFTAFLAIQTLLVVKYSWNDTKMRKVEIFFFAFGISFTLITAVTAASLNLMNSSDIGFCWIATSPKPCDSKRLGPLYDGYCKENLSGENRVLYAMIFAMSWALLTLVFIIYAMFSLFFFVRQQELRASRWTLTSHSAGRQQKLVLARSIMYITVYVLIWIPSGVAISMDSITAATVVAILLPLQGVFNAIIYTGIIERCCISRPSAREVAASTTNQFSADTSGGLASFRNTRSRASRSSNQFSLSSGDMSNIPDT